MGRFEKILWKLTKKACTWYEKEAAEQTWSVRTLQRNISSQYYYYVRHGNGQLLVSKYKLYLTTEEELRAEIETQKAMFYLQQREKKDIEI